MQILILSSALGIWLLQQQATLPNPYWAWVPVMLVPLLLVPQQVAAQRLFHQVVLAFIACSAGFLYAAFFAQQRLADSLPAEWQGKDITVIGVVAELPRQHERGLRFIFDVEQVLTPDARVPSHILLATYQNSRDDIPTLHAGERWQLTVRLKQPHGSVNPHGFDFEAWMLERTLRASGYVRPDVENVRLEEQVIRPGYLIEHVREKVRDSFRATLHDAPYAGILIALAIGDQASIPGAQWLQQREAGLLIGVV